MKKLLLGLLVIAAGVFALSYAFPGKFLEVARNYERSKAGLEQKSLLVNGDQWPYLEGGNPQGETILMVHGFGADKDNWTRMAPFLADEYRLIAMDLPGFGENARHKSWVYTPSQQIARLHDFAAALGVKRYHIVGNSMGGHISALYAHRYPDEVITLGLLNNAGVKALEPSDMESHMLAGGANPLIVDSAESFDAMMGWVFVKEPYIPGPVKRYFANKAIEHREFNAYIFSQYVAERRGMLEAVLPSIKQPTLVLWGAEDRLIDVSTVEAMKPLLESETVVILEDVGHAPMIEVPEITAEHYRAFLHGAKKTNGQ